MGAVKTDMLDRACERSATTFAVPDVSTALARALSRLLTATVDTDLKDGIGLSVGAAGAREQALEALERYEASHG